MDYTELPRSLIFKDRTNLNDFGVQNDGTINNYLFTQMRKLTLLHCGNAKEIALRCFNNAYYICTLTQLDEYPDLCMDKYEKILLEVNIRFPEDVYQASMALVCVLLAAYDDKYKQKDNLLIESIYHWTSSNKWTGSLTHKSFEDIIKTCNTDSFTLPQSEFDPCDIIEVVETFDIVFLKCYAEYISERLALLKDPRQRMYGADTAIARIKDYQRELCKESEYNPKKDCFKYTVRDFSWEESVRRNYQQSKKAIDYYTEHYPTKEDENDSKERAAEFPQAPETEVHQTKTMEQDSLQPDPSNYETGQLQTRIKELQDALNEEKAKNAKLEEEIAILCEPVKELTATQNIRLAFALQLFRAAGLKDEKLDKRNRQLIKIANLLSLLLDIHSNNKKNNPAHTCAKWLSHREYVTSTNKEQIIELNKCFAELDWEFALSLENPKL